MNRPAAEPIDPIQEGVIFALWRSGFDTADIANRLGLKEWQVANLISRVKDWENESSNHRSK